MSKNKDITYRTKVQRAIAGNRQNQLVLEGTDLPYAGYETLGVVAATKPQGRLTLQSGVAVPLTDQDAQTSVYWTPFEGATVPIFDSIVFGAIPFGELTLALDSNAGHTGYQQQNKNFDCFVFMNDGEITLGTGPAWTTSHARSAAIGLLGGIYVNSADIVIRFGTASGDTVTVTALEATYVGTFRAQSGNGQTYDSKKFRLLYNAYNRVPRYITHSDETTNSWTYSTDAWQIANADATNAVFIMQGLQVEPVVMKAVHACKNSTNASRNVSTGIGLDFVDVNIAQIMSPADCTDAQRSLLTADYSGYPEFGFFVLTWLEYGNNTDTQTWYGDNGLADNVMQTGLFGQGYF